MTTKQLIVSHLVSLFALLALSATIPLADRVASELASLQVER